MLVYLPYPILYWFFSLNVSELLHSRCPCVCTYPTNYTAWLDVVPYNVTFGMCTLGLFWSVSIFYLGTLTAPATSDQHHQQVYCSIPTLPCIFILLSGLSITYFYITICFNSVCVVSFNFQFVCCISSYFSINFIGCTMDST